RALQAALRVKHARQSARRAAIAEATWANDRIKYWIDVKAVANKYKEALVEKNNSGRKNLPPGTPQPDRPLDINFDAFKHWEELWAAYIKKKIELQKKLGTFGSDSPGGGKGSNSPH